MAVVVQCYNCDTILELDEGFRGGVCRCSTCGSLLQVPKASGAGAKKARPAAPGAAITDIKRPDNPNADPGLSRGQFDATQQAGQRPAVPDFGGSSSGLRQARPGMPTATKVERSKPVDAAHAAPAAKEVRKSGLMIWLMIGLGATVILAVVIAVIVIVTSSDDTASRGASTAKSGGVPVKGVGGQVQQNTPPPPPPPPAIKSPNFVGMPLVGKQIIISLDTGSSMQDGFDYVRKGCYQAVDSLEPGQTIVIAVWDDTHVTKIPASGFVGKSGAKQIRDALEKVPVRGATDAASCMKATLALGGDQVIFVTAKFGLGEELATQVLPARKGNQRLDTVKLNSEDNPSPFEALAKKTNGKFVFMTQSQLEHAVNGN